MGKNEIRLKPNKPETHFGKTYNFLKRAKKYIPSLLKRLDYYGKMGVEALKDATPRNTGVTADSWIYYIAQPKPGQFSIIWRNTNLVNDWASVAVLIQYGHATRNGGYVEGIDYINPTMRPIFEKMAKNCWKEVETILG